MDTNRRLVESATRGDVDAVEALMQRHLPALQRFLRRHAGPLLGGKESSSDLVQSVCREVIEHLDGERFDYRGEAEFKQWLYGAAELKLRNKRRYWAAGKRDPGREAGPSAVSGVAGGVGTPSQDAMKQEQIERLRAAIHKLPERDREIVTLAHVENLPHREIAGRLGISEAHSRMLLSRALARLATLDVGED